MNATILHESRGRIRFRMRQKQMTLAQADLLKPGSKENPGHARSPSMNAPVL